MKIAVPSPVVPPDNPFLNDKLKREPFANALSNLVQSLDDPTVITINAPWGEGKTTFANMWRASLKNKGCRCIYIDAFANDYVDDPFIVLVGEIASHIQETYCTDHPIYTAVESLLKKASHAGVKLLSFGTKIGLKAATLGILKNDDFKEMGDIKDALTNDSFDFASDLIENKLRSHRADVASIEEFKNTLADFAEQIKRDTSFPLILIIDELDRCRPTYAVDFIEKVKHLFSGRNIIFVLILNKLQLAAAVSSVYGQIDSISYLQKFFTIETSLTKSDDIISNDYKTFCSHIFSELNIDAGNEVGALQSTMIGISEVFCLSLRDIERCYSHISLYYAAKHSFSFTPLVPLMIIIKLKDHDGYNSIRSGTSFGELQKIQAYQKLVSQNAILIKNRINNIMPMLRFCTLPEDEYKAIPDEKQVKQYQSLLWDYNVEREEILPMLCKRLEMFKLYQA
ncbi:MAG: hypothetical protein H7Y42_08995 [Chitinophagaceae bacterium]|nr:hypothetical protein [Chitinophagaceae bacterium]